uniref:Ribosomal protein S16 n=3 Tax=Trifolium TaxID=3898 RepID=V9TIB7_TRIPR|nr:ribosomal protein S16 [Trifolium pratense]
MVVSIRLARLGCTHRPFYRVVVADSKSARDGKNIEVVGYYNPLADKEDEKRLNIKLERVKYWLSVGAQPSESVETLLFRSGLQVKRKGGLSGVDTPNQEQSANDKEVDGVSAEAVFSIGLQV